MDRPCVLLCTANGVGLGHLSRMMAVGRALEAHTDVVVFTLSQAAAIPVAQGFHTEFVRSSEYGTVDGTEWNDFYAARLGGLIDFYQPTAIVFDGPHPYMGLCKAIADHPDRQWVWFRRGMWRADAGHAAISRSNLFPLIIEPGEFAADYDHGLTATRRFEALRVGPVTFGTKDSVIPRAAARAELGLDPDRPAALVQLGAGQINDVASLSGRVLDALRRHDIQVAVAESVLVRDPVELPGDVIRVRRYPLAAYTDAFDLSFMASGYNSFHEALALGLPTLFIPNLHTKMDDQSARARYAAEAGVGLQWSEGDPTPLESVIDQLADPAEQRRLREGMRHLPPADGAAAAAAALRLWAAL
ncbi:MAG: glycosyltransferase [Acidimicrobiales bacterium]